VAVLYYSINSFVYVLLVLFMVNRRRRTQRTRRPQGNRAIARKLHTAVGLRPMSSQPPADPPRVKLSHEYSAVLQVDLQFDPEAAAAGFTDYGSGFAPATYVVKAKSALEQKVLISASTIARLIRARMFYQNGVRLEIAPRKVSAWGPTSAQLATEATPLLAVDTSAVSAGITVTDRGTLTRRSRVGVAIPYTLWLSGDGNIAICSYYPAGLGAETPYVTKSPMGILQISATWRVTYASL